MHKIAPCTLRLRYQDVTLWTKSIRFWCRTKR